MLRVIPLLLLSCQLGAAQAEPPKLTAVRLHEHRHRFIAKRASMGGYEHLGVTLRLEGIKEVRTYGNVNIAEAKTDTGADLIRRPKDKGAFFGVTNVPAFFIVSDYQAKSGKVEVQVDLHRSPRGAKKLRLKGAIDVLTGGEPTHVDFADFRGTGALEDKALTAAGLKITPLKDRRTSDTQLWFSVEGDNSTLLEVSLIDGAGKKIQTTGGYYYQNSNFRGGGSYSLNTTQKAPKGAKLRVTLVKGGKRATIPFAFDLDLP